MNRLAWKGRGALAMPTASPSAAKVGKGKSRQFAARSKASIFIPPSANKGLNPDQRIASTLFFIKRARWPG
jgi:hypothetical protein